MYKILKNNLYFFENVSRETYKHIKPHLKNLKWGFRSKSPGLDFYSFYILSKIFSNIVTYQPHEKVEVH